MTSTSGEARADLAEHFRRQIEASVQAKSALLEDLGECVAVASELIDAYRSGHALLLFGNGGSAADAQHIAAEFLGHFYLERPGVAAHALTVNTSALTAISNDYSFDAVFARQLVAIGRAGDVAVGISTSGNAANVIEGLRAARRARMVTVAMTGADGGRAKEEADHWVRVPSNDVARIQESHIMIGHIWSELVEAALFGPEKRRSG
ncbi:MAG: SIS domain-containing protein [Chloroflexota bacterium]